MLSNELRKIAWRIIRHAALLRAIPLLLCSIGAHAALTIDAKAFGDGSAASPTISTAVFSTTSANELLLAFVATDYTSGTNTTVTGVSGGGLTWVLVQRSNVQSGSSEIWRAFAINPLTSQKVTASLSHSVVASISVVSFIGADTTGTNGSGAIGAVAATNSGKGAPTGSVTTTRNGSWVFGVGNDYTNAVARTLGPNQSLIHQLLTKTGDTYWVQGQTAPTPLGGTSVTINDTAPTGDRFNLAIAEVLPSLSGTTNTYAISGLITPAASGSGASVALMQGSSTIATTIADATGSFTFASQTNGTYTVIPNKAGFTITPASEAVTVNGSNVTGVAFTASAQTWSVSGTITPAAAGISVALSGTAVATTTPNAYGAYSFTGLANGNYTITPSATGETFTPTSLSATVNGANLTDENFTAQSVPTWSISGTISPAAAGAGAAVALSGSAAASTIADANGNYSFPGLANGTYTVTPTRAGYSFTPPDQSVAVNSANQTGINFTGQAQAIYTISGNVGGAGCSGCAYVQSTHSSQSGHVDWPTLLNVKAGDALVYIGEFSNWVAGSTVNMTDSRGNTWYRCDNNSTSDFVEVQDQATNGMSCHYTVNTAAWPTITAQPVSSQCVATSCTAVGGSFFELALPPTATADAWATPYAGTSTSGADNVSCGSMTTTQPNDFLMCDFNNASGTPTAGTSPIAFSMRETIVTAIETGLDPAVGTIIPTGTLNASGIPYTSIAVAFSSGSTGSGAGATMTLNGDSSATTTADGNGNYSFPGLANGSYTVTPSKAGYSFTPLSQPVTINGANQTAVNFTAQAQSSLSISGTISPAAGGSGATVTLSGTASATTTADANGNYSFAGVANGSYTVTPTKSGYTFTPASQAVIVNGSTVSGVAFTATGQTWGVSGAITPAAAGISVALSGTATASTTTNASGAYSFTGLANGNYTITPSQSGETFTPASLSATINGANVTGENFTGQSATTYSISGSITPAAAGINVVLTGTSSATTTTNSSGNYSFSGLTNGAYVVTPSQSGLVFSPASLAITISGASLTGENFTSASGGMLALVMDAKVSGDRASASTQTSTPVFSTSIGQELLLAFVSADYVSGANTTVTGVAGGGLTWTLVQRANVQSGDAEIWRAFAAAPLSDATVTATLSHSVLASITVVSFEGADATGSNGSGAIGAKTAASGSSGAPIANLITTRNGSWVFGVGNDFDNAIPRSVPPGQSLIHQDLTTTGDTYWVQMQNAVTPVAGTAVSINDTAPTKDRYNLAAVEVLPGSGGAPMPPTVTMISPAPGTTVDSGTTVAAAVSDPTYSIAGVQFQLDGANLGAEVTSAPYSFTWNTTTTTAGQHTLTAIAYNSAGLNAISAPVTITVDNSGNPALVGSWSNPVSTPAVAVNLILLDNNKVLFYQDGATPTVWDYVAGTFTTVPATADLFCSGAVALSDGRLLLVGGYGGSGSQIGISSALIFDPSNNTFTTVPDMKYQRWYPTATALSDGRVLVTAGWQTTQHSNAGIPEIYDPVANQWTQLILANNPFETYPFMFLLTNGLVIHTGGSEYATDTETLNLTTQTWTSVDSRIIDGGSATMYLPNKIMKAGSATDSQETGPSSNATFVLDMTQPTPLWQQTPSMAYARSFMNLTELPDGTVLATGGESDKNGGNIANAVYSAELWSPITQTWTTMASMHTPREYHGTALLLPDGRVLESGMGADFGNVPDEKSAEFYSPPYLFKGARPTITQAPSTVQLGTNFFVGTPDAASIASAVLIRTGAVTHFFDQNTRFVPVTFVQTTGGLTVTAPPDAYHAPPGYYMLFLVNTNGVPSIAPFVQITN